MVATCEKYYYLCCIGSICWDRDTFEAVAKCKRVSKTNSVCSVPGSISRICRRSLASEVLWRSLQFLYFDTTQQVPENSTSIAWITWCQTLVDGVMVCSIYWKQSRWYFRRSTFWSAVTAKASRTRSSTCSTGNEWTEHSACSTTRGKEVSYSACVYYGRPME